MYIRMYLHMYKQTYMCERMYSWVYVCKYICVVLCFSVVLKWSNGQPHFKMILTVNGSSLDLPVGNAKYV